MLTLKDCIGLSGLDPSEIDAIAEHEHIPYIIALEKGAAFLYEPWGPVAIRQMVLDDLRMAEEAGRTRHVTELQEIYECTCCLHPGGTDRRHAMRN